MGLGYLVERPQERPKNVFLLDWGGSRAYAERETKRYIRDNSSGDRVIPISSNFLEDPFGNARAPHLLL